MNERIRELAEQAKTTADNRYAAIVPLPNWDDYEQIWLQDYTDMFAELIVEECCQAFETEVDTWKQMDPYQGGMKRAGTKAIKQHFGVE